MLPDGAQSDAYAASITGSPLGLGALPDDERVIAGVEGIAAPVFGLTEVANGATSYSGWAAWRGPGASAQARLHALRIQVDAEGRPLACFVYDDPEVTLVHGAITTNDVLLNQLVANSRLDDAGTLNGGRHECVAVAFPRYADSSRLSTTPAMTQGLRARLWRDSAPEHLDEGVT